VLHAQIHALSANAGAIPIGNPCSRECKISNGNAVSDCHENRLTMACHVRYPHIVAYPLDSEIIGTPDRAIVVAARLRFDTHGVARMHDARRLARRVECFIGPYQVYRGASWSERGQARYQPDKIQDVPISLPSYHWHSPSGKNIFGNSAAIGKVQYTTGYCRDRRGASHRNHAKAYCPRKRSPQSQAKMDAKSCLIKTDT